MPAEVARLDWAALADCESGGDPYASSPLGYMGLYQFDLDTWRTVGGTGSPVDATPAEQRHRAQLLYLQQGAEPWPNCGHLL